MQCSMFEGSYGFLRLHTCFIYTVGSESSIFKKIIINIKYLFTSLLCHVKQMLPTATKY